MPLVEQMLTAIQKMHHLGIVHRDINPGNIFLHFPDLPLQIDSPSDERESPKGNNITPSSISFVTLTAIHMRVSRH